MFDAKIRKSWELTTATMKFFLHLTKIYMKKKINEPNFVINHKYSVPLQEEKNKKNIT